MVFSFNLFAEVNESENILNRFIDRAKLFGEILEHGEASDIVKMFKPNSSQLSNISVILVFMGEGKTDNTDSSPKYQDYTYYIANSIDPPYFVLDSVLLSYFNNDKESNNIKNVVAGYVECGATTNTLQSEINFTKDAKPLDCEIEFLGGSSESAIAKWNDKGILVTKKNLHLIAEKKVTVPELPRYAQENLTSKDIVNSSKTFMSFHQIKFPQVSNQKVVSIFKRIEYLSNMKRPRDLLQLSEWKLITKKEAGGAIHCVNGCVRDIAFSALPQGHYMSINKEGKILAYAEGEFGNIETRKIEDFYKKREDFQHYYWYSLSSFVALTKGVEVKFHSNGYPASYRTVVKNRLYGLQIEWNDKGELISEVDLDIPKEWKDTPKK
jgi:hypothetical protein